ncbi:MAG TPA: hypothetical protein VNL36_06160 [Bacteroidota bacterium]|nr:hypothetical protein [Bacteroidota bacterium]
MHCSTDPLRPVTVFLFLALISTSLFGQTTIRERVEIRPTPPTKATGAASSSSLLVQDGPNAARTAIPGVRVHVTGTTFQAAGTIPPLAGVEIRVHMGSAEYTVRTVSADCRGNISDITFTVPYEDLVSCGRQVYVVYRLNVWGGFGACHVRTGSFKLAGASVLGSTATFTIRDALSDGRFMSVPFTATVTVGGESLPGFEMTQMTVLPGKTTLQCTDNTPVDVTLKNASGQTVTICGGTTLQATASLEGVGPYAFLRQGTTEGQTITFPMTSATSSFDVVLDTVRGVIPLGQQQATLRVTVEGVEGTANINLTCPYPPPAVTITHPAQDTTIVLTQENQPILTLQEVHTPASGKFEPVISWQPSDRIDTREYFDTMQRGDTVEVRVTVMAENIAQMRAQDTRRVWLVKKGCDGPPCEGGITPPSLPLQEVKRSEMPTDPCLTPGKTGIPPGGGFRPLGAPEKPVGPFEVDACYDSQRDKWKFKVEQIPIRVFLDLCENNLADFKLINDVSEITAADACLALEDIRRHYNYPIVVRERGYILRPVLLAHEQVHKNDYQKALDEAKGVFEKKFIETQLACEEAGSLEEAKKKGEGTIRSHVMSLLTAALDGYQTKTAPPDYEQTIQESLEQLIKQYEDRLKALHPNCN